MQHDAFGKWLRETPLTLADGAWGSTCFSLGLPRDRLPEWWNLEAPDRIQGIAEAFARSRARLLSTNTFNGNTFRIPAAVPTQLAALNRCGVEIVRAAAAPHQRVYGAMGPSGMKPTDARYLSPAHSEAFLVQAEALLAGGADLLGLESMLSVAEAVLLVKTLTAAFDVAVLCSYTWFRSQDGCLHTLCGAGPAEAAHTVLDAGAAVIGVNCCAGPEDALAVVQAYRAAGVAAPVWASPNAGLPRDMGGTLAYPIDAQAFATWVPRLAAAGASIVGGCCGVGPEYVSLWRP
ncbi:MAG: homocysteine S-methyltransferase family protein [Candidatus Hydrogenedentes bacterium]|nr:homocysteine S-methyltransferase family protein [Candidatus Hydrogenedentota bacterium]